MALVWRIARVELAQLRRSGVFVLLALVLAGLLGASAVVAWRAEQAYEEQRQRYQGAVEAQWAAQPSRHPHRVSHYGYLLFRPRSPLGFFDTGVNANVGSTLFLEAHRQNSLNFAEAAQADAPLRFGGLSLALVLQLLVPLVIFVAAAGAVAREREDGTLALVLAQGAPWWAVLAGKSLALTVAGLAVAVPAVVAAGAGLVWHGDTAWTGEAWTRAAALTVAHGLYLTLCAALGVAVSAWCRTSRDATLALVGLWLALWVVVPRIGPALGASAHDLPTRAEFEADVERRTRALGDSHNPNDEKFAAFRARVLAEHGVTRVEDLPMNYNGVVMAEGERLTTDAHRAARARVDAVLARQAERIGWAGLVSPYVAMRMVSMTVAGASLAHAQEFEQQAEDYRGALVLFLNTLHADEVPLAVDRYEAGGASEAPTRLRLDADHWQDAPTFTYRAPTLAAVWPEAAGGAGALAAWAVAVALVLVRARPRVV